MTHLAHTPASSPTALAPDVSRLDPRAARAWTEKMAVTAIGDGEYVVFGQGGTIYDVDLTAGQCSCPDHTYRGERCKHIRRVALEITGGRIPAPDYRAVTCMACGERSFVRDEEPAVCESCRFTPGTTVRDQETGDLLVVVEQTGQRADCILIQDSTVAEYPTNTGYPHGDPVVRCVYPFSGSADLPFEERRRYAFPHSRLEREWRPARPAHQTTLTQ
ncbi:SWIM zinc finger family protein [Halocatena marina]|uniref:SWIM zinc finger family protein n=1 Tax=Halocatena marina TaxID=2934937 RepID=UPI00200C2F93|nr:SWIM zinc finger family protein [Halocatena marina]